MGADRRDPIRATRRKWGSRKTSPLARRAAVFSTSLASRNLPPAGTSNAPPLRVTAYRKKQQPPPHKDCFLTPIWLANQATHLNIGQCLRLNLDAIRTPVADGSH